MAKLLVLDSSETTCATLKNSFSTGAHSVTFVQDKDNLLQTLENEKFDIALVDTNFKPISYIEAFSLFTNSQKNNNIQTILTTAKLGRELITKFNSLGAAFMFMKPYRLSLLVEKINLMTKPKVSDAGAFDPLVIKIFLESTMHIFDLVGHMAIEAGKPFLKSGNKSLNPVSAVINLSSFQLRGSLAICLDREILKRFLVKMLGKDAVPSETYLNDICGEICNQVMGRAKQQFLKKKGMSFEISVPTVLSGFEHILDFKINAPVLVIPFIYEKKESIFIEFCLALNHDVIEDIQDEDQKNKEVHVEEGEFILF